MTLRHRLLLTVLLTAISFQFASAQGTSALLDHSCADIKIAAHKRLSANKAAATPEYYRLMNHYDVSWYKLDIALERTSIYIAGSVNIQASALVAIDTFEFELYPSLIIDSVRISGQLATISRTGNKVSAVLGASLVQGSFIDALIYYKGNPPSGGSAAIGNGISNGTSPSWGNQVTWTLSEPYSALEWFPVKQSLTDKADSSAVYITTSPSNMASSNSLLKGVDTLASGKHRYRWESRYPIDYYLICASVSNYFDYSFYAHPAGADSILIQNYLYQHPNLLNTYKLEIDVTAPMVESLSTLYGLYPFAAEKYGHTMVPIGGGMEHQTMTSQGYFTFTLTAHELGHQWFGDNVTCASWRDIWVNEGFGSYSENLALEFLNSPASSANLMLSKHNNVKSQTGGSVYLNNPLDTNNVNRIFSSRLSYNKGSSILHTFRHVVNNDQLFFQSMRNYQALYAGGVATGADFRDVLTATTGINYTPYFAQWYYGEGYPTFAVTWNTVSGNLIMRSAQTTSKPSVTPLFTLPMEYSLQRSGAPDTIVRVFHGQPTEFYTFAGLGNVTGITVDPENWVINNATVQQDGSLIASIDRLAETALAFEIYPNPSSGQLNISFPKPGSYQVIVADLSGRQVLGFQLSGNAETIDVGQLTAGVYLISVIDNQGARAVRKVIRE